MALCEFIKVDFKAPGVNVCLTFIEFLVFNGLKHASIFKYISAIKALCKWLDLDTSVFYHPKMKLMLKAVEVSVHTKAVQKGIFDIGVLTKIVLTCKILPPPPIFTTIYLFAFLGFFRISNLASPVKNSLNLKTH